MSDQDFGETLCLFQQLNQHYNETLTLRQKLIISLEKALTDSRKLARETDHEFQRKLTSIRSEHDYQIDTINIKL